MYFRHRPTLHASVILASKSFLTLEYLSTNARYSSSDKTLITIDITQTQSYDSHSSQSVSTDTSILYVAWLGHGYEAFSTVNKKTPNNQLDSGDNTLHNYCSTMWGKKTAPFYFCNSFVRTLSIMTIFGTHIPQ